MMRLSWLVLLGVFLMVPTVFAQSPDYLPNNSDHWYGDLSNPNVRIHRYGGILINGYQTHHIEVWEDGAMQSHSVWTQSRDDEGNIFNHQASFNGGATWFDMEPPLPLIQSPLTLGNSWDYECDTLPLTSFSVVTSEQSLCQNMPLALGVTKEQNYNGSITIYVDHYIDGFGVAMMEWNGTIYMAEDCTNPVSVDHVAWETVKAIYR